MKQALITGVVAIMAFSSAIGRLGETQQEIVARYGQGQLSDIQRLPGAQTYKYFKNEFQIEIVIDQGKSIWEIIQRQNGGGDIPDKDIKNILDGYKESKRTWRYDLQKKLWQSGGSPKYIAYRWPGHEDYLCIKDVGACKALDKTNTGSKGL